MSKYVTNWSKYPNFTMDEFKCPCCNSVGNGIADSLVSSLQSIRNKYGSSITISSGYRCPSFNAANGGAVDSAHLTGAAADWYFSDGRFSNQNTRIAMVNEIKNMDNYHYSYCNVNNNYPNMGTVVHCDFNFTADPTYAYDGYLDVVTNTNIYGWANDGLDDTPLEVHVYIYKDGLQVGFTHGVANIPSSDVGNHRFDIEYDFIKLGAGTYTIVGYIIHVDGSNSLLKTNNKTITICDNTSVIEPEIIVEEQIKKDEINTNTSETIDISDKNDIIEVERKTNVISLIEFIISIIRKLFKI